MNNDTRQILLRVGPLVLALLLALAMAFGLFTPKRIQERTSPMVGLMPPSFTLPLLGGHGNLFLPILWKDRVAVINIFASWCEPCKAEQGALLEAAKAPGVNMFGIAWKDSAENVSAYLSQFGNPYRAVGVDQIAQTTLVFGITGLPETYVLDRGGYVRWKHSGPLTMDDVHNQLLPLVNSLNAAP